MRPLRGRGILFFALNYLRFTLHYIELSFLPLSLRAMTKIAIISVWLWPESMNWSCLVCSKNRATWPDQSREI